MTSTEFITFLLNIYDFSDYCLAHPVGWIGCNKFWGVVYLLSISTLFIICYKLVSKILRERREWRDYLAKKAKREYVADTETMAKIKWKGDF